MLDVMPFAAAFTSRPRCRLRTDRKHRAGDARPVLGGIGQLGELWESDTVAARQVLQIQLGGGWSWSSVAPVVHLGAVVAAAAASLVAETVAGQMLGTGVGHHATLLMKRSGNMSKLLW